MRAAKNTKSLILIHSIAIDPYVPPRSGQSAHPTCAARRNRFIAFDNLVFSPYYMAFNVSQMCLFNIILMLRAFNRFIDIPLASCFEILLRHYPTVSKFSQS